ncbi:autotransporter outer membrane beta-barrel domain-containing protein [Salinispora mooreana]|uniref:right-handed parallel beta-helix repeat-containing protein n=1 Tax=Salinispora mooreana TaxID=999545 RepID=UPI000380F0F0|nr:right-handed parallel beta-helix repeat-containing protein [Salinispora mooreana]
MGKEIDTAMTYHHHTRSPGVSQAAARRRRRWAVGLAGMTGLALTTAGLTPAPANANVDANASSDTNANAVEQPHTTTDDGLKKPDQPPTGNHRGDSKGKGKEAEKPKGTPVPCDTDALIAAITLANARGGATLNLAKGCTYLLTADIDGAGLPAITTPITLNGHTHTTIERAAATDQFRILTVNTGGDLTLNKLRLTGGQTTGDGGAILVNPGGALTTNHSTITRNIADSTGGGIANNGTTRIKDSTISHNTSSNIGGGINSTGLLDIKKSEVKANTAFAGAGIVGFDTVRIEHSTITANHTQSGNVGGLFVATTGIITGSRISHNTAMEAGGLLTGFGAQLTLRSVTLDGNTASAGRGGGLAINPSSSVVTEGGVITNNTATTEGGGIYSLGDLVSRNTAITNNQADQGGGVFNLDSARLIGTKVVKNIAITDGGGIFNNGGTVELNTATGTVVIKNRPNNCVDVPDCAD